MCRLGGIFWIWWGLCRLGARWFGSLGLGLRLLRLQSSIFGLRQVLFRMRIILHLMSLILFPHLLLLMSFILFPHLLLLMFPKSFILLIPNLSLPTLSPIFFIDLFHFLRPELIYFLLLFFFILPKYIFSLLLRATYRWVLFFIWDLGRLCSIAGLRRLCLAIIMVFECLWALVWNVLLLSSQGWR